MELLDRIDRMTKEVHRLFEDASPQSVQRARLLNAIAANNGTSQTALVAMTGIDRSTMTTIIGAMERDGLVRRDRSKKDGRAVCVSITATGRANLRACQSAYAKTAPAIHAAIRDDARVS